MDLGEHPRHQGQRQQEQQVHLQFQPLPQPHQQHGRGPPHEMDEMVEFAWKNYKPAKRKLYIFELRLCSRALEFLQNKIEALPAIARPINLWFRRVTLFGDDIEQSLHKFLMQRTELETVTLIGWTRQFGEGASLINDYIPILNCISLTEPDRSDPARFPHHITSIEVEQMRLTQQDIGILLGNASTLRKVKFSRSTLDLGFLSGFCATRTSPRTLKMVQCFAASNSTLQAMANNSWQQWNQMHELDLQNNRLTSVALASIADLLNQQRASLRELKLGSNFELLQSPTPDLWHAFVTALSHMQQLHTIQLESCKMTVRMATELVYAVRNTCRTLDLQGTNLFDIDDDNDCAKYNTDATLSTSTTATTRRAALTYTENQTPPPSSEFCCCLATNACSLVDLVLRGCNIGNLYATLLFAALEHNRTLETLDLRENPMKVRKGTWETSLPRLSPILVQLWLPLTNFLSASIATVEDSWSVFECALSKNLYLTDVMETGTGRTLTSKERVSLCNLALRNKGLTRARAALQSSGNSIHSLLWPQIMARLWHGWESDHNASAVYTFFRRSAEGEEFQTMVSAALGQWKNGNRKGRKRPLALVTQKDDKS